MRVLFFIHACGRTGSELALQRLICHSDRTWVEMVVACGAPGPLTGMFPPDVPVLRYWHALTYADRALPEGSWSLRLLSLAFEASVRRIHRRVRPDLWYVNTLVQPQVVRLAHRLGVPCVVHAHEHPQLLTLLRPADVDATVEYPRLVIAASHCAAGAVRALGRSGNVEVCGGPIVVDALASDVPRPLATRKALGIPTEAFVWAMAGTRDPGKNPVAFALAANQLLEREPNAWFVWIGGEDTGYSRYARGLVKPNLQSRVLWIGERGDDYVDHLNAADAVVLTSAAESLSMVVLEAAALGKPFVSFPSGGPQEILRAGMGEVVASWNIHDLVDAMSRVMRREVFIDPQVSRRRALDFDVAQVVPRWEKVLAGAVGDRLSPPLRGRPPADGAHAACQVEARHGDES